MNGKCAKRIRNAARNSGDNTRHLKREYRDLPYHRRNYKYVGIPIESHSARLRRLHVNGV